MAKALEDLPMFIDRWVNGILSTDIREAAEQTVKELQDCLLYTSPSPRDRG